MSFDRERLERFLHEQIPITAAMAITVEQLNERSISLAATLAANHNDKGTAFGGSLSSVLTLSGWALLLNRLHEVDADIVIARQEFAFRLPVKDNFVTQCELPDDDQWQNFTRHLAARGRARIELQALIGDVDNPAVEMTAHYAAIMRRTS